MVMSGSQRSKEDDVQKIYMSVFVTNFLDGYGAKDLWNTCKLYGHVVDVFIPDRRTKAGKRFGFMRFIKVLDINRLINNLCTVWVGRNKIHANLARFQMEPLHKQSNKVNNKGTNNVNHGAKGMTNSYAHVVKGNQVQNVDGNPDWAYIKQALGRQLITKIRRKMRVLTDEVLNSLSASTCCRALDTTTLRELISFEGRVYDVPLQGAYIPPGYDQRYYQQYEQQQQRDDNDE
nr:nucleotide-binding alpha-beta plait domain-containing protein [Tanacetum cinerariifolium]